jgi:hypothetical protein
VYSEVSLAEAREKRDQARKLLLNDVDSGGVKQANKHAIVQATDYSFQSVVFGMVCQILCQVASQPSRQDFSV